MVTRFEFSHATGFSWSFYGSNWTGQTFTPSDAHTITLVKVHVSRTGSPGTVTVSVRAVDGSGHPTGGDLASGTFDGDVISTSAASPTEQDISLGSGVSLDAGTQYALVIRAPSGDGSNSITLQVENDSVYAGGNMKASSNSGTTWRDQDGAATDWWFEEWGDETVIETGIPPSNETVVKITDTGGSERDLSAYVLDVDGLPGPVEPLDVTPLTALGHVFIQGLENVDFTLEMNWSDDDSVGSDTVFGLLRTYGSAVAFVYGPRGNDSGQVKYSGDCYVTNYEISSRVGSQVMAFVDLQVDGVVTRGTF